MDQEYISKAAAIRAMRGKPEDRFIAGDGTIIGKLIGIRGASKRIGKLPAADVAPVKHAHWIENPTAGDYTCSACGRVCADDHIECPYCHCGAKMF